MIETQIDERIRTFIERLERLDPGERARLKRGAGCSLAEARGVLTLFYRLLPPDVPAYQEEAYFLVATLFPLGQSVKDGRASLGDALRRARNDKANGKGLDRRMETLLDATPEQLAFRLRQAVHFLASNRVPVNWAALLNDLLLWGHPDRIVQRRWARAYFGNEQ